LKLLFDAHAHLCDPAYTAEAREEMFRVIQNYGPCGVVDAGFDLDSSGLAAEHARRFDWCYASAGIHPLFLPEETTGEQDYGIAREMPALRRLATLPRVKAIGETGIDYHAGKDNAVWQEVWFRAQIRLALELDMPLVIHARNSLPEVIRILSEESVFSPARKGKFPQLPSTGDGDARVLLHAFSGSAEQALECVRLGACISLAGAVTHENSRKAARVAKLVPEENLLLETDSPYMTPHIPITAQQAPIATQPPQTKNTPPRVQNTPAMLIFTAQKIASLRGISYEELARSTTANSKRFYNIMEA
jgi:TatD DNase family protein